MLGPRHLNSVLLASRYWTAFSGKFDPHYPHQLKQNVVRVGPSDTFSGSAYGMQHHTQDQAEVNSLNTGNP